MSAEYILKKLSQAKYKRLEDGSYFGAIAELDGVWANEKTLDACQRVLGEVLEEWVRLKLQDGDHIPDLKKQKQFLKQPQCA